MSPVLSDTDRAAVSLAVFGSRSLTGDAVEKIIRSAIDKHRPAFVLTAGEPEGVCAVARSVCRATVTPLMLHFLDTRRCAGKYHWRSVAILKQASTAVFIHDGHSHRTRNEMKLAKAMNVPIEYHELAADAITDDDGCTVEDIIDAIAKTI